MQFDHKLKSAYEMARLGGVLICDVNGVMESIGSLSKADKDKIAKIYQDTPEIVVGFYQVNEGFDFAEVKQMILDDTIDLI